MSGETGIAVPSQAPQQRNLRRAAALVYTRWLRSVSAPPSLSCSSRLGSPGCSVHLAPSPCPPAPASVPCSSLPPCCGGWTCSPGNWSAGPAGPGLGPSEEPLLGDAEQGIALWQRGEGRAARPGAARCAWLPSQLIIRKIEARLLGRVCRFPVRCAWVMYSLWFYSISFIAPFCFSPPWGSSCHLGCLGVLRVFGLSAWNRGRRRENFT